MPESTLVEQAVIAEMVERYGEEEVHRMVDRSREFTRACMEEFA